MKNAEICCNYEEEIKKLITIYIYIKWNQKIEAASLEIVDMFVVTLFLVFMKLADDVE